MSNARSAPNAADNSGGQAVRRKPAPSRTWAPWLVLAVGLLSTAAVSAVIWRTIDANDTQRFNDAVENASDKIAHRLDTYLALMRSGAALFTAEPSATAEQFHRFIDRQDVQAHYPGIQGIGYCKSVRMTDLESVVAQMRENGEPEFQIKPEGPRDEYFPVLYLEPQDRRNRVAIGFDMFSEPVRHDVIVRARDGGAAVASMRVTLIQEIDPEKQAGFLIFLPVYQSAQLPATIEERRSALTGLIYSPFRADDFFRGVFANDRNMQVDFAVYDGPEPAADHLMHTTAGLAAGRAGAARPRYSRARKIDLAGHTWTLWFVDSPAFAVASSRSVFPLAPLIGGLLSIGLFLLMQLQVRARAVAEQQREAARFEADERLRAQEAARIANEGLQTTVRELEGVHGELRAQNQELTNTRQAIEAQRRRYLDLFEFAPDGYIVTDLNGVTREANVAAARMLNTVPAALVGRPLAAFAAPECHDSVVTLLGLVMKESRVERFELRLQPAQGNAFDASANVALLRDREDGPAGFQWLLQDITERKAAHEHRQRLAAIVETTDDAIVSKTAEGIVTSFNAGAERIFGYRAQEIIGKHISILLPEDRRGEFAAIMERLRKGERIEHFETVRRRKDGRLIDVSVTISPLRDQSGKLIGASKVGRDITESKETREKLQWQASLLDQVHDSIIEWSLDGRIGYWNEGAAELYGYSAADALGQSIHQLLRTEFRDGVESILATLRAEGAWAGELVHMARDGRRLVVDSRMRLVHHGDVAAVIETNRDTTARRLAEEGLRNSEAQYRASFALAAVGKAQIDPDTGQFLRVNQRLCEITGYDERELLGMTFAQITHPDDRQDSFDQWERVRRGDGKEYQTEKRYVRKDGEIAWVQVTGTVVRDHQGKPMIGIAVVHDITERKRDEAELAMHRQRLEELITKRTNELEHTHQRLRLSERMAALGTLSAGLGHDMGNLLLPLRLRLDSMEAKGVAPALREDLDAVRKCAEYLQRLANGLRLFALDPDAREAASEGTDLNDWWADVYSFYKNALPRPVALEARFAPGLPPVRMGRPNLTQAIFNLVQNAGEAVKGREDGMVVVWAEPGTEDGMLRLGVTDNGQGMSDEIRQRCLEPFFTTKTRGISTGLGLALVHGIVQKAGGSIQIDSEKGRGTTFILTVPAAQPRAAAVAGTAMVGRPRALLTIDDARLRAYVASVLHSMAFDVSWSDVPDDEPAMLWLTDPNQHLAEHARRFLAADQDRRIIVLGPANNGLEKLSGLVQFSEPPKPAIIRRTLREMVGEFALLGLMESTLTAEEM